MKKLFFFFALLCAFWACQKEPVTTLPPHVHPTTSCMKFEMTQCADVWGYPATSASIAAYFTAHQINATITRIDSINPGMVCAACTCTNGKTLFVEAATAADITKLTAIGFVACSANTANNSLVGLWHYVWEKGGIAGFNHSIVNQNRTANFTAAGVATYYQNGVQNYQHNYTIGARDTSFEGDFGLINTSAPYSNSNFTIRHDTLWIYSNINADGIDYTLVRHQ